MTIKQKFSSIDQSKLTADQKSFLDKIKNVTKNFSDAEMNKKVEQPLDNFIAKAKEKMPEAVKSAPAKSTDKAKPSQTRKPKRTPMSLAKEIRKDGEKWSDARARASKMMKEDSKDLSKTVETELDKLSKLVRSQKTRSKLVGISGTNIKRDSARRAKPKGRRISKEGNIYYENRDNRTDRLAPNYPKNAPLLQAGGDIDAFTLRMVKSNGMQPAEVLKEDTNVRYNKGGSLTNERKHVNHSEDYEVRYAKPRPSRTGYRGNRRFELGGVMTTDLAGYTGGGDAGLNAGMPLSGVSGTAYTGLVGETGAMSSGEMFMAGGTLNKDKELISSESFYIKESSNYDKAIDELIPEINKSLKKKGISLITTNNEFDKEFDRVYVDDNIMIRIWSTKKTKNGVEFDVSVFKENYELGGAMSSGEMFMNGGGLPSGAEQSYMVTEALGNPAQHFATGGGVKTINGREYSYGRNWTNDHEHINKSEEHEVTYNRKGKFLGIFKEGGAIKNQYAGRTPENIWDSLSVEQRKHFLIDHLWANEEQIEQIRYKRLEEDDKEFVDYYAVRTWKKLSGDVRKAFTSHVKEGEYNRGGALTNERLHVNHDEDYEVRYAKPRPHRKGYKDARKFMAGGSMETPRIYVADLEAYNNGRLVGEWLDLADYNDADELMDAIQDVLKQSGGEEYAIHDVEYVPRSMYSEYMGKRDFEQLYEMMDLAKQNDLPLEVVEDIVSQYSGSAVEDFVGKYDNAEDFAQQMVDDLGIESFTDFQYYLDISETDRRLLSQEMADSYVNDIIDEDNGNRLIEEAGLDVEEYEEADSDRQEEMLDEAKEIVYDEYYDNFYNGLNNPYYFLVEEQGLYDAESFSKANFVRVDYEKLGDALEQDYTFIQHDGYLYVFNIR
jgi:antirestriction protein